MIMHFLKQEDTGTRQVLFAPWQYRSQHYFSVIILQGQFTSCAEPGA